MSSWAAPAVVVLGVILFVSGILLHFEAKFSSPVPVIYGDGGDGLFNLWVMEHVTHAAGKGPAALADGRIFWPLNACTYWWSDNLLVPSAVYAPIKWIFGDMFAAYRVAVLLFSAAGYAVFVWLFIELWRGIRRASGDLVPVWTEVLAPFAAYLAFFSLIRIDDYLHFQNLAVLFLVMLVIGALRHAADLRRRDWLLMLVSELLLLYSAPYYAVLGLCVLLCRGFFLLADRRINLWAWGWRNGLIALPLIVLCMPAVYMYVKCEPVNYQQHEVQLLSLQPEHLFTPQGGWLRGIVAGLLPDGMPVVRRGGYPGMGLLAGAVLAAGLLIWNGRKRIRCWCRPAGVRVFLLLWVVTLIGDSDFRPFAWWLRLALIPSGLFLLAWYWRSVEHSPVKHQAAMLLAAVLTVYGTAFGPGAHFKPPLADISVWSVFSWMVPGYLNMREVLRFSSLGHLLLLALLWWLLIHAWVVTNGRRVVRLALGGIVVLLAGLQFSETVGARVLETRIQREQVDLNEDEAAFFGGLKGSMLVVPSAPFHRNTFHQLRWVSCKDLYLLNGYSARSTDAFDRLMRLEREHGMASDEQIACAAGLGAQHLCLIRGMVPEPVRERLRRCYPVRFENEQFLVFALEPRIEMKSDK